MSGFNHIHKRQAQRGNVRFLAAVILLLAIAGFTVSGTGYLNSGEDSSTDPANSSSDSANPLFSEKRSRPGTRAERGNSIGDKSPESLETTSVNDDQDLGDEEGFATDTVPSLSISGRVLSESGVPQKAVSLQARRTQGSSEQAETSRGELSTFSGAQGYYEFLNLAEGEYLISAMNGKSRPTSKIFVQAGADGADIVIPIVERTLNIQGWIDNPEGEPVEEARVSVAGNSQAVSYSDEEGFYEIRVDVTKTQESIDLQFQHDLHEKQVVNIDFRADLAFDNQLHRDFTLNSLQTYSEIAGVIKSTDGQVVAGETVWLYSSEHDRHYTGVSDQDGLFSIANVASASDYRVQVRPAQSYRDYVAEGVQVSGSIAPLEVRLETHATGSLSGEMLDQKGFPVPGFGLWLRNQKGSTQQIRLTGDELGFFSLDSVPAGELVFESRGSPQIRISGVYLPVGEERDVTLTVDWGPFVLEGRVTGRDNRPVPGATLVLTSVQVNTGVNSRSLRTTKTDLDGLFHFVQLGPGIHTLDVKAQHFEPFRIVYDVGTDTDPLELQLRELY